MARKLSANEGKRSMVKRYERFVIKRDGDQCWGWTGAKVRGYGRMGRFRGSHVGAHRVSYEIFVGPIPPSLCVLHRCDNRECSNPKHLFLGTAADNNADRDAKGRAAKGGCNGRAILTEDIVASMRKLYRDGDTNGVELSRRFNISTSTVYNVLLGQTWKHVP